MALPLRHELKFLITRTQLEVLRRTVGSVLNLDPNAKKNGGSYHIRSLYFDTAFDDALYDKIAGVKDRDKYRIRIYNLSDAVIFMECKTKVGSLISKRSLTIPKLLCEQLMAGDPAGLETTRSGLPAKKSSMAASCFSSNCSRRSLGLNQRSPFLPRTP